MPITVPLWLLFSLVGAAQSSEIIFSAALPSIATNLNLSSSVAQLCSAFYFCGFTLGIVCFGRASDIFGRRKSLILGLIIYVLASCAIVFVQNIYILIVWRLIQAFGASSGSIIPQAVARDCYAGRSLAKIYTMISIIICIVPSTSGAIGGLMVEYFSWRHNVMFMALMGICMIIGTYFKMPETMNTAIVDKKKSFCAVLNKMRRDRLVLISAIIAGGSIGMLVGFIVEFSITFVGRLQVTPSAYGMLNIFVTIAMLAATALNMRLIAMKYDYKKMIIWGSYISTFGCLILCAPSFWPELFTTNTANSTLLSITLLSARIIQGIGHIILMPYIMSAALRNYQNAIGSAGAIFNGTYYVIISIIIFFTSFCHSDSSTYRFAILMVSVSLLNAILCRALQKYL